MKRLTLVPVLVILTVFGIVVTCGPASGGGEFSFEVAVNVETDPSNHAKEIEMPENIKLTVTLFGDFSFSGLTISGPHPWVEVTDFDSIATGVEAAGSGTVAGNENVAVEFTGIFDLSGTVNVLSGIYMMGVDVPGSELLPGGQPIAYRIKPKPVAATQTPTATATPDFPPPLPTATEPTAAPPTATPTVMSPAPIATATTPPPGGPLGDANCDTFVNSIDAALILQFDVGLVSSLPCEPQADVNGDATVNSIDGALVLQFDAGLIPSL